MGLVIFLSWWYGAGWANSFKSAFDNTKLVTGEFSLSILFRTLFEPWKQLTVYSGPGASFDVKLRVLSDNIFSRIFGFVVRTIFIIIALLAGSITLLAGLLLAIIWPVIPLATIFCLFMAGSWL